MSELIDQVSNAYGYQIVGTMRVPTASVGGDTIFYTSMIDDLFFDAHWDPEKKSVVNSFGVAEFPKLYPNLSAFNVTLVDLRNKPVDQFIAIITSIIGYEVNADTGFIGLKFKYRKGTGAGTVRNQSVIQVKPFITKTLSSDDGFLALVFDGDRDLAAAMIRNDYYEIQYGGKTYTQYHVVDMKYMYSRTLDGKSLWIHLYTVGLYHLEHPAPKERSEEFITSVRAILSGFERSGR